MPPLSSNDLCDHIDFDDPYIKLACGGLEKSQLGADEIRLLMHMAKGPVVNTDEASQVANFYDGRSVFITGATGFIGKALVEKLIRSCTGIRYVYILVREKKNKTVQERLDELLNSRIFMRIRSQPNGQSVLESKVRVVCGNINLPMFGVSDQQMRELNANVSIVFNSAATIKFSEPLENAVQNNIVSVKNLVEFCLELKQLDALIHLSTAYSNCHKKDEILEILYEPPMHGSDIIKLVHDLQRGEKAISNCAQAYEPRASDNLQSHVKRANNNRTFQTMPQLMPKSKCESLLQAFTRYAMHQSNRPNTYTLTKSIAEFFLCEQIEAHGSAFGGDEGVEVAIVRPSVVGCSHRQPIPGYVDNFNGPSSPISFTQTGALQIIPVAGDKIADFVPLDMIVNFIICCGCFMANKRKSKMDPHNSSVETVPLIKDKGVYVFNYVSGKTNPLYWRLVATNTVKFGHLFPSVQTVRLPCMTYYPHGRLFIFVDLINQKLPAYLLDKYQAWTGAHRRKHSTPKTKPRPSATTVYHQLKLMTEALLPFAMNEWKIDDTNTRALLDALPEADKRLFDFDIKHVDWNEYLRTYNIGVRVFLHHDSVASLSRSKTLLKVRKAVYLGFVLLVALTLELCLN